MGGDTKTNSTWRSRDICTGRSRTESFLAVVGVGHGGWHVDARNEDVICTIARPNELVMSNCLRCEANCGADGPVDTGRCAKVAWTARRTAGLATLVRASNSL
jgi:hypothetical protein